MRRPARPGRRTQPHEPTKQLRVLASLAMEPINSSSAVMRCASGEKLESEIPQRPHHISRGGFIGPTAAHSHLRDSLCAWTRVLKASRQQHQPASEAERPLHGLEHCQLAVQRTEEVVDQLRKCGRYTLEGRGSRGVWWENSRGSRRDWSPSSQNSGHLCRRLKWRRGPCVCPQQRSEPQVVAKTPKVNAAPIDATPSQDKTDVLIGKKKLLPKSLMMMMNMESTRRDRH